ncbi:MAG: hypothetical protein M3Y51_10580 [Actinomycetota bacterium]|nr:hypothetical protein [Actinomycetota bacterium]
MIVGVYPGSFSPLTIAHLAVADAARAHLGLDRLDLAISRDALGKPELAMSDAAGVVVDERVEIVRRSLGGRAWLDVVVVDARLIVDIAQGYDAVVMGADKWAQVNDPAWYGGDPAERDAVLERLPRLAVAPRQGVSVPSAIALPVPAHIDEVSSSAVRAGRTEWAAAPDPSRLTEG